LATSRSVNCPRDSTNRRAEGLPILAGERSPSLRTSLIERVNPSTPGDTTVIPSIMAFTVRTDEALERALDELVKEEGLSRQEIIRRAILDRYERAGHAKEVADSADRMVERWGDVLDRLGSV